MPPCRNRVAGDGVAQARRPLAVAPVHAVDLASHAHLGLGMGEALDGLLDRLLGQHKQAVGHERILAQRLAQHRGLEPRLHVAVEGVEDQMREEVPSLRDVPGDGQTLELAECSGDPGQVGPREHLAGGMDGVARGQRVVAALDGPGRHLPRELGVALLQLADHAPAEDVVVGPHPADHRAQGRLDDVARQPAERQRQHRLAKGRARHADERMRTDALEVRGEGVGRDLGDQDVGAGLVPSLAEGLAEMVGDVADHVDPGGIGDEAGDLILLGPARRSRRRPGGPAASA
jgi:hypothetical protein